MMQQTGSVFAEYLNLTVSRIGCWIWILCYLTVNWFLQMWRPQYTFFQNRQLFWINLCGKKTCCQLENRRVQSIPLLMDTSGKEGGWSGAYVNGGCVWGGEEISCGWGLDGWESITLLLFAIYVYIYIYIYTTVLHPSKNSLIDS